MRYFGLQRERDCGTSNDSEVSDSGSDKVVKLHPELKGISNALHVSMEEARLRNPFRENHDYIPF